MRRSTLYTTVAFLCCGQCSLFAQLDGFTDSPSSIPTPRAAANADDLEEGLQFLTSASDIPDPFAILEQNSDTEAAPSPADAPAAPAQIEPAAEIDTIIPDPSALEAEADSQSDVVDRIVDQATVDGIPHANLSPIDWNQGVPNAPNHVARVMMRQECVDGLWNGYAQMRAEECAHMWAKLTATKKCHDGSCGKNGCGAHGCGASGCGGGHTVNRYTGQGCDGSCADCAASANASLLHKAKQMARATVNTVR